MSKHQTRKKNNEMSKQNEGSAAIHNAVSQLLIDGNVKGALALANCLHAPGRSITASAATPPKREKKVVIKTTKAKVSLVKAKAKPKASRHAHAHKGVKLTAKQWAVWIAVKALLDARDKLTDNTKDVGFDHLSGKFVAQFIGTASNMKEQCRINHLMMNLKKKGLLVWETKQVPNGKIKIKSGFAFGPEA
jgi:hypothetical protein